MHETLLSALDYIHPRKIQEAATLPAVRKRRRYFRMGLAAVLALVLISRIGFIPMAVSAEAVALASESRVGERPDREDYPDYESFRPDYEQWMTEKDLRFAAAAETARQALPFFTRGSQTFLSGGGNRIWSPVNAYIGLAMLAETTGGETRDQLLSLLGAENLDALRTQITAVWETTNRDDGNEICTLANSLWLDNCVQYHQEAMDALAYHHFASVYRGNFGTARTNRAIGTWLNNHTGGMLKNSTGGISLPEDTLLALYSTIYFQAKWSKEFSPLNNTQDVFHAPGGDVTATYMNRELAQMDYFWGESYGAVSLWLKNGSQMWFILPDEDKTLEDVLSEGEYLDMITGQSAFAQDHSKYMKVNLSIPKFDVSASQNLAQGLQKMGVQDVFILGQADFSPALATEKAYVSAVNQALRVQIDEQGVKAAVYIEIPGAGAAMPPEEMIDFILDRPFLFVIASNSLPLFAGVVENP